MHPMYARLFLFQTFCFYWGIYIKYKEESFVSYVIKMEGSWNQNKESKESNTNYNCKTMDFFELRHLFTSKIADNYICIFTQLSYLNKLSLHENVSSYLLVAHLELEIACISQSFFIHSKIDIGKQMLQTSWYEIIGV